MFLPVRREVSEVTTREFYILSNIRFKTDIPSSELNKGGSSQILLSQKASSQLLSQMTHSGYRVQCKPFDAENRSRLVRLGIDSERQHGEGEILTSRVVHPAELPRHK